ncbi:metallophosphoesterase [Lactiplantibacillus songbeiensis]|uniref:Metallophosphoesterase n=1 Tax=Lactiplantibacillus songbeiensis TaxID=2559920 RepID=A0ABW4C4M6_9LACO|nr:metallophosphoesterase family protein [Lactiplantibacillus songbeiensis]
MKTIFVGDLHLKARLILPLVTQATSQVDAKQVILLGDYLDDYNCNFDAQLYWDELNFLIDWKRQMTATGVNVITLLGNHDAPYLTGELRNYSLHAGIENNVQSTDVADTVAEKLMTLGVQIATEVDGWLVSHAGYCENQQLAAWQLRPLTLNDDDRRNVKEFEHRAGQYRGGWNLVPSPLWADIHELRLAPNLKYPKQIVGHTPQATIDLATGKSRLVDVDTFTLSPTATPPYYRFSGDGALLLAEDGRLSVMQTDWQRPATLSQLYEQRGR